ncbi:MAG: hypothetical protein ACK59Y_10560 [Betaproteobacteria bacterium]|jgi:hypothetical protein|nr:hypothetical protein [Betaproteobacteria bacterium]
MLANWMRRFGNSSFNCCSEMNKNFGFAFLFVALLAGCGGPYSRFGRGTDWPGTAVGRVVASTFSPSGPVVIGPDGKPIYIVIPIQGTGLAIQGRLGGDTPEHYHYQIQKNDGTLLVLQSEARIPTGACIVISGYADGPSMTHWSFGRTKVGPSDGCKD